MGQIDLDPEIFHSWDPNHESLKYTWYLSIAYALSVGALNFSELEPFRKSYKESKAYKKYLRSHPNHFNELTRLRGEQLKSDLCDSESSLKEEKVKTRVEDMLEDIKFYKMNTQYEKLIPRKLKVLVEGEMDQDEVERRVREMVMKEIKD